MEAMEEEKVWWAWRMAGSARGLWCEAGRCGSGDARLRDAEHHQAHASLDGLAWLPNGAVGGRGKTSFKRDLWKRLYSKAGVFFEIGNVRGFERRPDCSLFAAV